MAPKSPEITVACPCCGAQLVIDAGLGKVVTHEPPPKKSNILDLDRAGDLLKERAARREAIFNQSKEDERIKPDLLERKFEEELKKRKDEPITKPTRDIDLD